MLLLLMASQHQGVSEEEQLLDRLSSRNANNRPIRFELVVQPVASAVIQAGDDRQLLLLLLGPAAAD
jgi:hypothetical protein